MGDLCAEFRMVIEASVETVLLNKVVMRFRRSIGTANRIGNLGKITSADCQFLDDLMTRYSVFEHSQSPELPAILPKIEPVKQNLEEMEQWIAGFKKR